MKIHPVYIDLIQSAIIILNVIIQPDVGNMRITLK